MAFTSRYEDLTWPEVNEAVSRGMIPVLPVGTMEQHGPHLPIKMDRWTATEVVNEASKRHRERLLAMPPVAYGYTTHVMDFPGSITIHHETFIRYVVDILKSVAYHGFKRIIVVNGHGSNVPPLDLAARRAILETDAMIAMTSWWSLTAANPQYMKKWRKSHFPGGCAHACEAETSMALHMDASLVQMDKAKDVDIEINAVKSKYHWVDLWAAGPVAVTGWTSTYTENGTAGEPTLATKAKGRKLFEEAVRNLIEFSDEFAGRKYGPRKDHHTVKPTIPVPG
jgi:creatinine amidohydrolase